MPAFEPVQPFEMIRFRGQTLKYFVVDFGLPRPSEIDFYQVLWNGHYINYFESSRQYLGEYLKLDTKLLEQYGYLLPVYSYSVQMRSPVTAADRIRVGVRPMEFRKGLLDLFHVCMSGDQIKAVGHIVHAVVEKESKSIPSPIPAVVQETVARILAPFTDEALSASRASSHQGSEEAL